MPPGRANGLYVGAVGGALCGAPISVSPHTPQYPPSTIDGKSAPVHPTPRASHSTPPSETVNVGFYKQIPRACPRDRNKKVRMSAAMKCALQ